MGGQQDMSLTRFFSKRKKDKESKEFVAFKNNRPLTDKMIAEDSLKIPIFQREPEEDDFPKTWEEKLELIVKNYSQIPSRFRRRTFDDKEYIELFHTLDGRANSGLLYFGIDDKGIKLQHSSSNFRRVEMEYESFSVVEFIKIVNDMIKGKQLTFEFDELINSINELYILVKEQVTIDDVVLCRNMELKRDYLKKLGYETIKKLCQCETVDAFDDYELLSVKYKNNDLGNYLKMVDPSTKALYLLHVPKEKDYGKFKIPIDTCVKALAWSYEVSDKEYRPEVET